jgi:hypothetical protein
MAYSEISQVLFKYNMRIKITYVQKTLQLAHQMLAPVHLVSSREKLH